MPHLFKKLVASAQQLNRKLRTLEDQRAQEHDELVQRWHRVTRAIITHRNASRQSYLEKRVGWPLLPRVFGKPEQLQPIACSLRGSSPENGAGPYLFITKSGRLVYKTSSGEYRYLTDVYAITDQDVENMERAIEP